jgi:hypothetical protein
MKNGMTNHEKQNTRLITLFDELLRKRPDVLDEIPNDSTIVMQMEGNESFNRWALKVAEANAEGKSLLLVKFTLHSKTPKLKKSTLAWKSVEMELQAV